MRERLEAVRRRVAEACQRCGREAPDITLIGVTKGVGLAPIREAIALGLVDLGENRVQEALAKQSALGSGLWAQGCPEPTAPTPQPIRWHLIGHLQRNKAKEAVRQFEVIHSLDSAALAEALERHAAKRTAPLEVLIQVNVSGEATKFGCAPDGALALAQTVKRQPHLRLTGLMTMAPFTEDTERSRPYFRRLRLLRDNLQHHLLHPSSIIHHPSLSLSMGMSQDFEVAIEEGADYIRVGTAIFGGESS